MEETPRSTESTAAFPMGRDGDTPNTSGEPEEVSALGEVSSPSYGPAPMITSRPSFSPSTSSSVHPFKLERFVDNKGNPRTRVYLGRLRYLINNFEVIIQSDTKSTASYSGSMGTGSSEVTGAETGHTHSGTSTVTLPQHTHDNSGTAAAAGSPSTADTGNGTNHTHSISLTAAAGSTSGTTGTEAAHTHGDGSLIIPDHQHENDTTGTLSGTDHTHSSGGYTVPISGTPSVDGTSGLTNSTDSLDITGDTGNIKNKLSNDDVTGTTAAGSSHSHSYAKDDHTHSVSGTSGTPSSHTHEYETNNHSHTLSGETGEVYGSLPDFDISTGSSTGHTHPIPTLTNSLVTVDRFVCVKSQIQGAGFINEVEPTGFTALKDSNDKDTVVKTKEMTVADTYGSFFLKWKVKLSQGNEGMTTINQADVTIHRDADTTKTAEVLQNADKMELLAADSETATMGHFRRGTDTDDNRTAYYYVKIGASYDPNAAGTNAKTIEQMTYENIYWSPLFISSASA